MADQVTPGGLGLGWNPDQAQRAVEKAMEAGFRYATPVYLDDRPIPPSFSLSQFRLFPQDQGPRGTCAGNAANQAIQIDTAADVAIGEPWQVARLSRRYCYYRGRLLDGTLRQGGDGASVSNMMRALAKFGTCRESTWPYTTGRDLEDDPPPNAVDEAKGNYVTAVAEREIGNGTPWQRSILNGNAIDLGTWWDYAWDRGDAEGRVRNSGNGTYGHSYLVTGWAQLWGGLFWQCENSHGLIYKPLPDQLAKGVPGYKPAETTKTSDFWVSDADMRVVIGRSWTEQIAAAGMSGWRRRDLFPSILKVLD